MNIEKKYILLIIIVFVIVAGIFYYNYNSTVLEEPSRAILFYSNECSHCEKLDKFISENKIGEKIEFDRLDIFNNIQNTDILYAKAKFCGLQTKSVGVPFFWDGKFCYVGEVDIVKFFNSKINAK